MKVISINAAETVNSKRIAFNVDEDLTPELLGRIEYGILQISGAGKVLLIEFPENDEAPFTRESVNTLNNKLAEAQSALQNIEDKRQRMLKEIAENAGLPLA